MHAWGLRLRSVRRILALAHPSVLPSALLNDVGTLVAIISQLNALPACAPVNASMVALRLATHDSGPGWFATPFPYDSFIHNSTPVYPGALNTLLALYSLAASVDSTISSEMSRTRVDSSNERDFSASSICVMQSGQPNRQRLRAWRRKLVEALLIDTLGAFFFSVPKASAICAAVQPAILAQMHVAHLRARNRAERRARAVPLAVVPRHMERRYNSALLSARKVSLGLCITAPGDLVDDFHHVEGLDLLL